MVSAVPPPEASDYMDLLRRVGSRNLLEQTLFPDDQGASTWAWYSAVSRRPTQHLRSLRLAVNQYNNYTQANGVADPSRRRVWYHPQTKLVHEKPVGDATPCLPHHVLSLINVTIDWLAWLAKIPKGQKDVLLQRRSATHRRVRFSVAWFYCGHT